MISNFQQQAHGMICSISDVDDQAKFWQVLFSCTSQSMYKIYLNFSDQNFSLVIVLSLFLIFGQISAWVFLLSLFLQKIACSVAKEPKKLRVNLRFKTQGGCKCVDFFACRVLC